MSYSGIAYRLPRFLKRHILHFEVEIEDAVTAFAHGLPPLDSNDLPVPHLYDAQRRGLGVTSWERIRQVKIRL